MRISLATLVGASLLSCQIAVCNAQGFAALVSPPRFELSAQPGQTIRQVLEISNRATTSQQFLMRTADWSLDPQFGVSFDVSPSVESCRAWTALERSEAILPPGSTLRYRFEVAVPDNAAPGECRFAILIESKEPVLARSSGLQFPVAGRIGVIVYVRIGAAAPDLEIFGPKILPLNGRRIPTLRVHNAGSAHGRMAGFLSGTDAKGVRYDFTPSDFPVLPGGVADVYLIPSTTSDDNPILTFPVHVTGTLEWGDRTTPLDQLFE